MQKGLLSWLLWLLVLWCFLLTGCARWFLIFPSRHRVKAVGVQRKLISDKGGKQVEVWIKYRALQKEAQPTSRRAEDAQPTSRRAEEKAKPDFFVLHFVGNASRAEYEVADYFYLSRQQSYAIWGVNYPGYGGSTGPARLGAIAPAALAAYDALAREAAGRPIVVSGFSLGTTAALYLAAKRPVAGVILRNPPPLQHLILQRYGWWNLWIAASIVVVQIPRSLDSIGNARISSAPAIFITSTQDKTVPPTYQNQIFQAYRGLKKRLLLPRAGHNSSLNTEQTEQLRQAFDWLHKSFKTP